MVLPQRFFPSVAVLNDDQIAITGGLGFDEVGDQMLMGDVVLFNINDE